MTGRALLLIAALTLPLPVSAQTGQDRARAAAEATRAKTGDSDTLLHNYLTPGLSGQAVSTVDSSRQFTPDIACQKTATLLEVLAQPSTTGDLATVRISRDTNLDGTFDASATLPVPVSGVCANGIISCDAGTWNNCHFYQWAVDAAQAPKLEAVAQTDLAGCYCINSSCGSGLALTNLPTVLKDLGGGIVSALTTSDPRYGVTQVRIEGPVIAYVGAQSTSCAASNSIGQPAYRTNPTAIAGDAASAAASSSIFQMLSASPAATSRVIETRNCTIERQIALSSPAQRDIISRIAGGYGDVASNGNQISFMMGSPDDNSLHSSSCSLFGYHMTLRISDPDRLPSVRLSQYRMDDWMQLWIDGQLVFADPANWTGSSVPSGNCDRKTNWSGWPNLDLKPWLTKGDHDIELRVAVGGNGEVFALIDATVDTSCSLSENLVDGCAGYAGNAACSLSDETIDGVVTALNGVRTGLKPIVQTRIVTASTCSVQLSRDFFTKDRRYTCSIDKGMADPNTSRGAYIIDHSTETLLADRLSNDDGSYRLNTRNFALPDRGTVDTCEPVCKTRRAQANTAAALDGVIGSKQNTPTGWDYLYHACQDNNVCPVGDGEELVQGCGCIDDFPEAVVMMQTMRLGGSDLICTGTVR
ncbi:hypothetical protein [Novosphingobium sp. KACC 22771]|uniref:hypothetical protein n=1 Tax=Novosphingobium sp. KACC 22771 TaxID=3025670 RepID=UPI00236739EC|nr:hypothetical protein [Novosphingobium sp. KACC 22771]WDF74243.1 hypothetical protein PQ467_20020 [Novosphingobium sp. KACC 22771]